MLLRLSGSHLPLILLPQWWMRASKLLRVGRDQIIAEGFQTPPAFEQPQCLRGTTSTSVQFIISFNCLKCSNFYTIVKGSLFTVIAEGNISSTGNHGNE